MLYEVITGSVTNSGRWHLWHYKAVEPAFEAKPFGDMFCGFMKRVQKLYEKEGGKLPEAVTWLDYPDKYDADDLCQRINGRRITSYNVCYTKLLRNDLNEPPGVHAPSAMRQKASRQISSASSRRRSMRQA